MASVPNPEGADTLKCTGNFPDRETFSGISERTKSDKPIAEQSISQLENRGFIIFVGMDMGPVIAAREQDTRRTVLIAAILILIGCSGIISLFLAQGYRSAKTSFSRIKIFPTAWWKICPSPLAINDRQEIISFNQTAESILGYCIQMSWERSRGDRPPAVHGLTARPETEKKVIEKEIDCPLANGRTIFLEVIATASWKMTANFLAT